MVLDLVLYLVRNYKFVVKVVLLTLPEQKNGRIDKRLLSELGFNDGGNVFYSTQTDEYNKAILRISIDASGSMGGQKIASAITCATAICKAASMIENLDVVVDMRSTINSGNGYSRRASNYYPLVVVVYDSRVDKFIKVKKHFPALSSAVLHQKVCVLKQS